MDIQTQGGGYNDPRWSHNGGPWNSASIPKPQSMNQQPAPKPIPQPVDMSRFKDVSGTAYTPFSVPKAAQALTTPQSNTAFAQAWNQARPQGSPEAQSFTTPGVNYTRRIDPTGRTRSERSVSGQGNQGNLAYAYERPKFFEQRATDFTGQNAETPDYGRRDAFIDLLNRRLSAYQRTPDGSMGRPSFDVNALWSQAGDMVQSGWQNPFALS